MDPSLTGLGDVLAGSLLGVIGLVSVALSLYRRKGADPLLASFGVFTGLYGIRLIFANPMSSALGISAGTSVWVNQLVTYTILVPAWYFFWQLLGDGWHRLSYWWVRVLAVFAVVGVTSDLIQGTPGTLSVANNIIVLLGLVVVVLGFWSHRGRVTTDLRILGIGLTIFGLFAINSNLVPLGILPWSWQQETLGFFVYVFCLGWIAARRFVGTERALASVAGELEAAKKIQAFLLPDSGPQLSGLVIATRFVPSSAVAGDFFDFLNPTPHQTGIAIADVSGHGVPAALIASMVKVAVESQAESADQPARLLSRVNQTLCGNIQQGFVSAAYLFLDLENRTAVASSGGHPYPLLKRQSDSRVREVGGRGTILGRFQKATFEQEAVELAPGDRWVLYTDGIVEVCNQQNEIFGEERLRVLLASGNDLSAEQFCDSVMRALHQWTGNRDRLTHEDDQTLVVVDYLPGDSGLSV